MPSFHNILPAVIAAAATVPLLLLLYFLKLRRREVDVSSTLLWKKAIQDLQVNAPFQRLRRNLLLLLQLLLLAMLALALSRPVVNYTPGPGQLSVLLIDRSASMSAADIDGKSRLDEAKRQARDLVDSMGKNAKAMIVAFDDSADIVRAFSSDRALLKQAIDSIKPTDRPTRLKTAFQLAEAKAMAFYADPGGVKSDDWSFDRSKPELYLFSDGRIADRSELALRNADLKYRLIGTESAENVAIVALSAKRNYERPTETQIFVRLANFGQKPAAPTLQLSIDGHVPGGGIRQNLTVLPDRWTMDQRREAEQKDKLISRDSAEFTLDLMKGAVVRVELKENPGDVLPADDVAQIIVPPPKAMNVLLVTPGNLWLEKLLNAADLKSPATVVPAVYEEKMKDPQAVAAAYDVILFDRYQPKALPPAGNFIYFRSAPPDSKLQIERDGLAEAVFKDQLVLDWDRAHPVLRGLNLRFYAKETLKVRVPIEAQVLVDGRKGPLIILHREGRHTHLVLTFDIQDSTWPTNPSFPVFFDAALQYMALGSEMELRQSFIPGSTPRIPRHSLQQAGVAITRLRLTGPFGSSNLTIPDTGDFALPPLDRVGLYSLDPAIPQYERLAVNLLDERESNLLPVAEEPAGSGKIAKPSRTKSPLELWWWIIALVAVPLCLVEWWVYTRRVHL